MELNKAIAARLQRLMDEKGVTVADLSIKTELPEKTIKNILAEKYVKVGLHRIFVMAHAMGSSIKEFFDDSLFDTVA